MVKEVRKWLGLSAVVLLAGLGLFIAANVRFSPGGGRLTPVSLCQTGVYVDELGYLRLPKGGVEAAPCGYTDADAVAAAEAEDPFDHAGAVNILVGPLTLADDALRIQNPAATFTYTFQAGAIVADRILTLPLTAGTLALVGEGGAPSAATYITQTPDGTLSAEQALSTLASGIMRVANATGVVTSLTTSADIAANIGDETGTGLLVFGTSPTIRTSLLLRNPADTFSYTLTPAAIAADRILNLPLLTGSDTLAAEAFTQTLTNKRITKRVGTIASGAAPTPAGDDVDLFTVTALAEAATFGAPTGTPTNGQTLIIRILDNGTARALAWNAIYRASSDLALPATTVISKTMYLGFIYNSAATKWDLLAYMNNY